MCETHSAEVLINKNKSAALEILLRMKSSLNLNIELEVSSQVSRTTILTRTEEL